MTKLEQFVQDKLDEIKDNPDFVLQEALFNQAFGAVELACVLYPEHEDEISEWWNNNKWNEFTDNIGV